MQFFCISYTKYDVFIKLSPTCEVQDDCGMGAGMKSFDKRKS